MSNKKAKELPGAGSSVQANMVIERKFVALQTEHNSDNKLDSNVNVSTGTKNENKTYDYKWLADTAATIHVTNQCDAFAIYEELPNSTYCYWCWEDKSPCYGKRDNISLLPVQWYSAYLTAE